tara:strand:+ start:139 stop:522 length:384 start_codon:yes stop_codon:yes gene_type:complete
MMQKGSVFSINSNDKKKGEARELSLLSIESIKKQGTCPKVKKHAMLGAGDLNENITTEGLSLGELKAGDRLHIGESAVLEVSAVGRKCYKYCALYHKTGDCAIPREGIFARILKGGEIIVGEDIKFL